MSDDTEVIDQRKIKQDELGPAARIRTTTLAPADGGKKKSAGPKTEAQLAVAAAKNRGQPESAITEVKKKKAPPPSWSTDNKAIAARAPTSERATAPAAPAKNPLEEATLYDAHDDLNWCGCGRALYVLADGSIVCRDGHAGGTAEGVGPVDWETAARTLRAEHTAVQAGALMQSSATDIEAFWAEDDARAVDAVLGPTTEQVEVSKSQMPEQPAPEQASPSAQEKTHDFKVKVGIEVDDAYSRRLHELECRVTALEGLMSPMLERLALQQSHIAQLIHRSGASFDDVRKAILAHEDLKKAAAGYKNPRAADVAALADVLKVWSATLAAAPIDKPEKAP